MFQRRVDGSTDFYRTWDEYRDGFGNASKEYWLGMCKIHEYTCYYKSSFVVGYVPFFV